MSPPATGPGGWTDRQKVMQMSPTCKSSFNSQDEPKPHKTRNQQKLQSIIVKSVNTRYTEQDIQSNLQSRYPSVTAVHRLQNKCTQAPFPIVKVTLDREEANKLLVSKSLTLFGKKLPCESCRSTKIIRCYRCQRFGHTASSCVYTDQCVNCTGNHTHPCTLPSKCFNCNGEHRADSKFCPTFIALKHKLEIRKMVPVPVIGHSLN